VESKGRKMNIFSIGGTEVKIKTLLDAINEGLNDADRTPGLNRALIIREHVMNYLYHEAILKYAGFKNSWDIWEEIKK
jgi:hypothetical protein